MTPMSGYISIPKGLVRLAALLTSGMPVIQQVNHGFETMWVLSL